MRGRLFGGRGRDEASEPGISGEPSIAETGIRRRLGLDGRGGGVGEAAWDRPEAPDDGADRLLWHDAHAGGAPWDRPGDEAFAPPAGGLHWAFQPPEDVRSSGHVLPPTGSARGSGAGVDVAPDLAVTGGERSAPATDGPWSWEDPSTLVTAGGGPRRDEPTDPAQPGLFDPYDAFAPVLADDQWRLPPRSVALPVSAIAQPVEPAGPAGATGISQAPSDGQAADARPTLPPQAVEAPRPPAAPPSSRESVFGDLFSVSTRPAGGVAGPTPAAGAPPDPGTAATGPSSRDPREWPPIPTGLLPPLGQPAPDGSPTSVAEPDGRRFGWPPPQPRVSTVRVAAAAESDPEAATFALAPPDQPTLWGSAGDGRADPSPSQERAIAARLAFETYADPPEPGGGPEPSALPTDGRTLAVIAAAGILLLAAVVAAQFVLPLIR